MKSVLILFISIFILSISSIAQSDIFNSKYIFNPMYFNPANTATHKDFDLTYSMKSGLRFGEPTIPNKEILSIASHLKRKRWSLGVNVQHESFFSIRNIVLEPSAAYRRSFNGERSISLGVSTSLTNTHIGEVGSISNQNVYYPNFGAGIFYKGRFSYLGFLARKIMSRRVNVRNINGINVPMLGIERELALNGGCSFRSKTNLFVLRPSVSLTRFVSDFGFNEAMSIEMNLEIELYDRFNFGAGYRDADVIGSTFRPRHIDAWFGYKDREKKLMLITNWDMEELIFLNRFTAELLFGHQIVTFGAVPPAPSHFF